MHRPAQEKYGHGQGTARARRETERELHTRLQQQAAVARLGTSAISEFDLAKLMKTAVCRVAETLGVEYAKVLELLPDGRALRLQAGVGWRDGLVGQATVDAGTDSQAGFTLISEGPVIVEDLRTEARFHGPSLLVEHGVVSGLSVIVGGRESPFGVLGAHTTRRRMFTQDDSHFLQAVANTLALAIERGQAEAARAQLIREEATRAAAEAARAHFAAIVESSVDAIIGKTLEGVITSWNPGAERLYGYAAAEVVGRSISLLIPPERPDELPAILERLQCGERIEHYETMRVRKDGNRVAVSLSISPIRDARGRPVGAATIARDMTERKRLEQALREEVILRRQQQEFAALVENSPDIIARFDRDLRHIYVNPAVEEATGLPAEAFIGKTNCELRMPEDALRVWELALRRVFATGREQTVEFAFPAPTGKRYYQVRVVPEFGADGSVATALGITRDMTARKQAEEEREQLYRALHDLIGRLLLDREGAARRQVPADQLELLTRRERDILRLLVQGGTNRQIGERLGLSAGTVKNYVTRLLPKLGATTRTQAAAQAVEFGLQDN